MNDSISPSMNSNTQLASVSYHVNQPQINSSMPFHETNQSFSTDNHHGLPLQHHLSNSYHSSNICQTPNAIEAPFYSTEGEAVHLYGDHVDQSSSVAINIDCQYQNAINNGTTKIQKDKRGNANLYKNISTITKNNRYCHGKNTSKDEFRGVPENSDGYTSSVSHSSNRFSNQRRSLSSTNGSSKLCKENLIQQPLDIYQKQPSMKPKQQKCQSLDRSSDSDFTSHLSSISSKKQEITSSMTTCDLCKLTFPSQSVLDNHLKGSRHTRRVKSQQAFRQLQDNGTNLRQNIIHEDGSFEEGLHFGEISCEVCEVSVNSSHQLQAHLEGHKHKVRCFRRGLHPSTAVLVPTRLVPSSSTPPSTAPSECSSTMPRSTTSFKYNPLSTSHYDTGTTTSSTNSYCLSNGTKSEGSRGGRKATNNKTSLLGEPPLLHSSLFQNAVVLNSNIVQYSDNQGDGLLPLPDNIKPFNVHPHVMSMFSKNKNVNQGMVNGAPQNIISQAIKHKSTKKVSRPSRNVTNAVRRYSTTESDDQTDLRKIQTLPLMSDKLRKDSTVSELDTGNTNADISSITHTQNTKGKSISIEANTSSLSAYHNATVIPFSIPMPQPIPLPSRKLMHDPTNETVLSNDNGHNPGNDSNTSFVSSSDDARELSEIDSDRISHILPDSSSISSYRKKLERSNNTLLDPILAIKETALDNADVPRSPTAKQHPCVPETNCSKLLGPNNFQSPSKTSLTHSCDMCNVIVNSAAQLTQHMNSPRHHVKVADCKTKAEQQKKEEQQKQQSDNNKLKEIPMLNMFLKTLQPPSSLPPPPLQNATSTCSSGNSQYFSSDKEGEGDSSSNTEVER